MTSAIKKPLLIKKESGGEVHMRLSGVFVACKTPVQKNTNVFSLAY